jgi:chaperonin GroES
VKKEKNMQLQPLADRLVARPVEAEAKTASGILLADQSKEKTQLAEVTAVGKDVKEVKVGDRIIHSEYGPSRFKQGSDEYLLLKEEDVLAVAKG